MASVIAASPPSGRPDVATVSQGCAASRVTRTVKPSGSGSGPDIVLVTRTAPVAAHSIVYVTSVVKLTGTDTRTEKAVGDTAVQFRATSPRASTYSPSRTSANVVDALAPTR